MRKIFLITLKVIMMTMRVVMLDLQTRIGFKVHKNFMTKIYV